MPRSGYVAEVRQQVGHRLLTLPSVTVCAFDEAGRLMLVRHDDGDVWAPPGGAIEPGETPADALVREAREELGVLATPTDLIGVFGGPEFTITYDNGDQATYVMSMFNCEINGQPTPDGVEVHEIKFVAQDGWTGLKVAAWMPGVLPEIFDWAASSRRRARFAMPSGSRTMDAP